MNFCKNFRCLLQLLDYYMIKYENVQMENLQCCDDLEAIGRINLRKIIKVGQKTVVFTIDTFWNEQLKYLLLQYIDIYNTVISLLFAETGHDIHIEEYEEIKEVPMSLKEVLQSLRRIKDICITLDKECGENAVEQCSKLYCLAKRYTIYTKIATAKQPL